jgi:hypothetical protein
MSVTNRKGIKGVFPLTAPLVSQVGQASAGTPEPPERERVRDYATLTHPALRCSVNGQLEDRKKG